MSRRPPPAANASARPEHPTRRLILGAAATPLIAGGGAAADPAAEACEIWLVRDAEHERLAVRWSRIEARLHRAYNWMGLTDAERLRIPAGRELDDLDDRIETLTDQNRALLKALPRIVAVSPLGLCGKLAIAARETRYEGEEAHKLIVSILRDYRAVHGGT